MRNAKRKIRALLRKVCSQHLWMALPQELEDIIVDEALAYLPQVDINASAYGSLFELAVMRAHEFHGYGTFATIYDDEITLLPIAHIEAFDDAMPGTYRKLSGCR